MSESSIFLGQRYTDRTLIESILSSFYIVDYGFIKTVNPDGTIDVTHAKQLKTLNGETLKATVTQNVEVLTVCGSGFSFKFDYKKGDRVLLLGLKDYVPNVENVISATETTAYLHYSRETLKAIPMCVFNNDAKVTVQVADGTLKVGTEGKIELNGNAKHFVTWEDLNTALTAFLALLNAHTHSASGSGTPTTPMTFNITNAKTKTIVTGG